jgi:PGF-pre-PGF domain-containing protein
LTILYYNDATQQWEELIGQVNTTEHYVWVNISHYSVYAVVASAGIDGGGGPRPGGGGGGRYNPAEIAIALANPGTNSFNFEHLGLAISEVLINLKNTAFNVKVALSQIEKPAGALNPAGMVYSYFDLPTNLAVEDIQSARIQFKVSKSWIAANNIDTSSIVLTRYAAASGWEDLETTLINEDSEYYYFSAETSALSLFAIAGTQEAAAGGATPSPTATPFGAPTPSPGPAATPTPTPAKRIPSCNIVAVLGAIALTVLIRRSRMRRA